MCAAQLWRRGHKAGGQGHKKSEAKDSSFEDRPFRGQGQECLRSRTKDTRPKCSEKRSLTFFRRISGMLQDETKLFMTLAYFQQVKT